MQNKAPSRMRELRKAQGLTLQALARKAGVSYTTVWNLENGAEEKVDREIKWNVTRALGMESPIQIFPSDEARIRIESLRRKRIHDDLEKKLMAGLIDKREARRILVAEGIGIFRSDRLRVLLDFCPDLKFEYPTDAEDIIDKMTVDELGDLFHSGLTKEEAVELLDKAADRLGLPRPKLKE